ncbi:MAG: NAD(+) diphosphatase [Herpetosiphonaceae bacterium]|nr:NAD(+) diphosphatase [Herpetosiphonaceae bacterium]
MAEYPFMRNAILKQIDLGAARCCLFLDDRLIITRTASGICLPDMQVVTAAGLQPACPIALGSCGPIDYVAASLAPVVLEAPFETVDLRSAYGLLSEQEYGIAGCAAQLAFWDRTTRFCPVCATPTERVTKEWSKRCPQCDFRQYPRVSPAIIVLIYRPGAVLLTRQPSWPPNRYSLVAGFVEAGESLEACARREVAEEVGVRVDQIRYLGSQPWPFPHQLMVGFLAQYHTGDVVIQESELEHAAWFDLDALPGLSPPLSISRRIIDWYLAMQDNPDLPFPPDPY